MNYCNKAEYQQIKKQRVYIYKSITKHTAQEENLTLYTLCDKIIYLNQTEQNYFQMHLQLVCSRMCDCCVIQ